MSEDEKEKHRTRITKAKKTPPPEPFRIRRIGRDVKIVPPPQLTRKTKPKEIKKEES